MSMLAHAQPSLLRESCLSLILFFSRREATVLLELGQRKHTKFYIACRLYWNSSVKEKKYRSWALKFVYIIGINSTKKFATCYSTDKKCQKTFTSFFLTQVSYDVFSIKKILETKQYASFLRVSVLECQAFNTSDNF